jgi:hypothetical protein
MIQKLIEKQQITEKPAKGLLAGRTDWPQVRRVLKSQRYLGHDEMTLCGR